MVAKLSIYLVFVYVVLPYYQVLCQDNGWQSLLDQAQDYGISGDTVADAQNIIGDSSMEQVAEDALRDGSLADWVIEATEDTNQGSTTPPAEAPTGPELAPNSDVENSPNLTPNAGPELAPLSAPSPAPYAASPKA
ncbi:hypothetical protein RYX36_022918 [Vicia faba]